MRLTLPALLIVSALLVAGCNREGPVIPTNEAGKSGAGPDAREAFVVTGDAGKVGSALAPDQSIATPKTRFAVGETVYLSVPAKNKPPGSRIDVFWFHEDGKSRKDDSRRFERANLAFEFVPKDAGKYNVEIDLNGRPIGLTEFTVQ